jgi:hypothetical protein
MTTISELQRERPGAVDLTTYDAEGKPGFDGGKRSGERALEELAPRLAERPFVGVPIPETTHGQGDVLMGTQFSRFAMRRVRR